MQFVAIPELTEGTRVYLGTAESDATYQSDGPYQVGVRVTTVGGLVKKLEDNGTEETIEDEWDHIYWSDFGIMDSGYGMPAILSGKSLEDLLNMQIVPGDSEHTTEEIDAVSGATTWANAVRYAAIDALRSAPVSKSESTVLAPTLTAQTCVPNASYKYIDVAMNADDDTTIRYTLDGSDPNKNSPEAAEIGWSGDIGVRLSADSEAYPDGQVVEVRAAAFDADGNRSDVVRQFYVFANPLSNAAYTLQPSGVSATVGGITATAVTASPSYDSNYYITSLSLDREHSEAYADFLPELFSRIYFAQTTEGVKPVTGHEAESKAVLAAVQAALNQALTASKPTLTVSPEKTTYANADAVTVTLDCPTDGAEIYYTVDNSNTLTGSTLSDPTRTGTRYENPFTVSIKNIAGGKVYVRAAAKKDGKWSDIVRKDLSFAKGVKGNAFVVDGKNYQSWADAVAAVNAANGGTIVLNDDVQLTEEDKLPDVACTIRSADGETKYRLSGSPMTMNADLTLSNISYALGNLYANGHNLTISNDVETAWSWTGYNLYAGSTAESTAAGTQHISVQAGDFAVIASGRGSTTHKADVDVAVGGSAEVELAGAYMGAKLDGNVKFTVAGGVKLNQFLGEQSGGSITGNLTLQINGTPTLKSYNPTYKASVNKDSFGTLDLTGAAADFITANRDKFTGFATVKPTA